MLHREIINYVKIRLGVLLLCIFWGISNAYAQPEVRLPPMKIPPKIDGTINAQEWREASSFSGFSDPRQARVCLGYDQKNLYLAMRSEIPPNGKLITRTKRRGGQVVLDDSVELWIVPPDKGRLVDAPKGKGYFQLIINQAGVIFDRHYEPGYGLPPQAWHVNLDAASKVSSDGFWEIEIAIPLKEFGMDKLVYPSEWKINIVRNWKNPWSQASLAPSTHFSDVKTMMRLILDPKASFVQVRSLGELMNGKPDIHLNVFNPTDQAVDLEFILELKAGNEPVLDEKRTIKIPAGQEKAFRFTSLFSPSKKNVFSMKVTEKTEGKKIYHHDFIFKPAPKHKWNMPEEFLSFYLSFDEETLEAKKSNGNPEPININGKPSFIKGIKGKAVFLDENNQITYSSKDNLSIPGAVSFWLKLNRDRLPGKEPQPFKPTYFWWTQYKKDGYLGIQDSVYGHSLLWLHYFPRMKHWNISKAFPWQKERWYHILANFDKQKAELYLDGRLQAHGILERPLKSEELAPFILGYHNNPNQYAIDELCIYTRPLTRDEIEKLAMGEENIDGKIAYLPSLNSLTIEALVEPEAIKESTYHLVVTHSEEKKVLLKHRFKREDWTVTSTGPFRLRKVVILPELKDATYICWLQEIKSKGIEGRRFLARNFVVKHYEWQNNSLGKSNVIIPPFTPLEVSGNKVKCVLRAHYLGNIGLWKQVESLGKEILARPVSLNAVSRGRRLSWKHKPPRIIESKPHIVRIEAESVNKLMQVKSVCEFDYDGLMKVTFNIIPNKENQLLDRLWLDIPVKKEVASLFHAAGEHVRANPGGLVPAGKGVVWQSRSIPQPNIDNFIPYIWVGEEERGICWAADWDKDWVHSDERSAVELLRQKGQIVIRVNFINGPIILTRRRIITFALQASPAKPMPEDWRELALDFDSPGRGRFPILWAGSWGAHHGWASRYPLDGDFTIIHKLAETKSTGKIDREFINAWIKKVMEHPGPLTHRKSKEQVRRHVDFAFNTAKSLFQRRPPGKLLYYSCARAKTDLLPENTVFNDEWQYTDRMQLSDSFCDYAVWYANKMMEAGMGGIYVDNSFPAAKFNWAMGEAYIGEDGEVHPSLGIWRVRNLIRRLAVMMYEKKREPLVRVHMTNTNILPILAFAQVNLGWEWKYGGSDYQERFTPAYIRAVNIGKQSGTVPNVLGGITVAGKKSEEYIRLSRTGLALVLPHEMFFYARTHGPTAIKARDIISDFRTRGNIEAYPYWKNQELFKSQGDLLITAYRHQDNLLLVVGNMGQAGKYAIKIDNSKLNLDEIQRAVNRETEEDILVEADSIILKIKEHDFALIEVSLK